jgi:hypothetical protein
MINYVCIRNIPFSFQIDLTELILILCLVHVIFSQFEMIKREN